MVTAKGIGLSRWDWFRLWCRARLCRAVFPCFYCIGGVKGPLPPVNKGVSRTPPQRAKTARQGPRDRAPIWVGHPPDPTTNRSSFGSQPGDLEEKECQEKDYAYRPYERITENRRRLTEASSGPSEEEKPNQPSGYSSIHPEINQEHGKPKHEANPHDKFTRPPPIKP